MNTEKNSLLSLLPSSFSLLLTFSNFVPIDNNTDFLHCIHT